MKAGKGREPTVAMRRRVTPASPTLEVDRPQVIILTFALHMKGDLRSEFSIHELNKAIGVYAKLLEEKGFDTGGLTNGGVASAVREMVTQAQSANILSGGEGKFLMEFGFCQTARAAIRKFFKDEIELENGDFESEFDLMEDLMEECASTAYSQIFSD